MHSVSVRPLIAQVAKELRDSIETDPLAREALRELHLHKKGRSMKLLSATVRNYRTHRETKVKLDDNLVLIHGPNESGKSTLAEAIHSALFLKAKGNTNFHKAMESNHGGTTEVELQFEARGRVHDLDKTLEAPAIRPCTAKAKPLSTDLPLKNT